MKEEGFWSYHANPDILMKPNRDVYRYVAIYVDDLAFAVKDPQAFINSLDAKRGFKLKGTRSLEFH